MIWVIETRGIHICNCKIAHAVNDNIIYRDGDEVLRFISNDHALTDQDYLDRGWAEEYWTTESAIAGHEKDAEKYVEEGQRKRKINLYA